PAWADSDAAEPLTRARCMDLALRSAPTAAAWEARRAAARARLQQASLLPNPVLAVDWEDFGLNSAATGAVQTTLSLAWALSDVYAREGREAAARHDLEAEEAELRADAARLAAAVSRAYDELVAARSRVALQQELADVAERERVDVAHFVSSGDSPRIDLERAEAELAEAQSAAAQARSAARAQELELAFALGFERPVTLQLADGLTATPTAPQPALGDLLASAAAARPELAGAEARYQAELQRLQLAADRVRFLPTVSAGPRFRGDALLAVGGLDVELPFFDSGAAEEAGEQAALLAAAAALRAAAQDVARGVCAAAERVTAAQAQLDEHATDLAQRRAALRTRTEALFRAGQAEYAEMALARRDDVRARLAQLDAQLAASESRIDLQLALGSFAPAPPAPEAAGP
ncbi:MAG TPA: TolC family protein, partial [Planctomycetota bacterium]|nr:TolC family protein [Planctomycetota bacterium]